MNLVTKVTQGSSESALRVMDYQFFPKLYCFIDSKSLLSDLRGNIGRSLRLHGCRVELKKRDPAGGISSGTAEPTHLPINSAEKIARGRHTKNNCHATISRVPSV